MSTEHNRSMAMEEVCEEDKMLDIYVYDFLKKRNFEESAKAFLKESRLLTHSPFIAIDVPDGFLLEWWAVFWDLFKARSGLPHSDIAASYLRSQADDRRQRQAVAQQAKLREQQQQQQQEQQQQQQQQQRRRMQKGQWMPDTVNNVVASPRMSLELRASEDALLRKPANSFFSSETLSEKKLTLCREPAAGALSLSDPQLSQNDGLLDNLGDNSTYPPSISDSLFVESVPPVADLQQMPIPVGSPRLMNQRGDAFQSRQQIQMKGGTGWPLIAGGVMGEQRVSGQGREQFGQSFAQHPHTKPVAFAQMQQQQIFQSLQNQAAASQLISFGNGSSFCERNASTPSNGGNDGVLPKRAISSPSLSDGSRDHNREKYLMVSQTQQPQLHIQLPGITETPQEQKSQQQLDRPSGVEENNNIGKKRKEKSDSSHHPTDRLFRADNVSPSHSSDPTFQRTESSRGRQQGQHQNMAISMGSSPSIPNQTGIASGELDGINASDFDIQVDTTGSLPMLNMSATVMINSPVDPESTVPAPLENGTTPKFSFREVGCLRASTSKVLSCHFSSDGNLLVSAGHDKKLSLWNMTTMKLQQTLEEHSLLITDVRFSPSSSHLATSSFDKTVRVWDVLNPTCSVRTFHGHATSVLALDFHPNNDDLLCSCDGDSEIRFWSVSQGTCLKIFKGGVTQLRFQPRIGRLLAAGAENVVTIFDVESDTSVYGLLNHSKPVNNLCWSASGDVLVSLTEDYVRVWSFGTTNGTVGGEWSNCIHELGFKEKMYQSCVFHPTYPSLLVIGCYQSMELWNMVENKIMTLSAHDGLIVSLVACPVTGLVASASHDKSVKLWQ